MTIPTSTGGQFVNAIGATQIPSYTPTTVSNPAVGSTQSQSATAPATPKQTYINNQVKSSAPATPTLTDNNISANEAANASYFNSNPSVFGGSGATSASTPAATPGVYNPYASPAYQQYVQNAVTAASPALSNPQIQQGILGANQNLENIQSNYSTNVNADLNNPNLSAGSLTGLQSAESQIAANQSVPVQTQLGLLNSQQAQGETAANIPLTAANTEAGYLGGIAQPQTVSPGQTLTTVNPQTGQSTPITSVPNFSLGTGIAGQPITYSQTGGQIYSGGTNAGLGTTPPQLGGTLPASYQSALQSVSSAYGLTDPASQTALQTAVANTLASNGSTSAANVPANLVPAVNAVLNQASGGQYSPGNSTINQNLLATEQATGSALIAPEQTAISHLSDLQSLANAVGYTNSPIASNIRNQFSSSILTDPSITTLQSAIGVVRSEVAKVLGGGTPTVASQAEAADALPDNLSPSNIAGVIANVQSLMNEKIQSYTNPANAGSLPNGLTQGSGSGVGDNGTSLFNW